MLTSLYSKHGRICELSSLPILGCVADGFSTWLMEQGYDRAYAVQRLCLLEYVDSLLSKRGIRRVQDIAQADLIACRDRLARLFPGRRGTTSALEGYLSSQQLLKPPPAATGITAQCLASYVEHLQTVQAAAKGTIDDKRRTASELLAHLRVERDPGRMKRLTTNDVEAFIKKISRRLSRRSLQGFIGNLRGFLRFLASEGLVPQGVDRQIDTTAPVELSRGICAGLSR